MKSICVVCASYPNSVNPASQVFVQQLVWAFADMGIKCTVICPVPVNQYPALLKLPGKTEDITPMGNSIDLYFPKFVSFGQKKILGFRTAGITTFLFHRVVKRIFKNFLNKPDVIYGHFLTPAGISVARIGREFNIPSCAAYGESSPWSIYNYGITRIKKELQSLIGIISVSSANKNDLAKLNIFQIDRIKVFPNGVRADHFYPRDKQLSRRNFGFDKDCFIVAFSGHFSDRKGVLRLRDAVEGLPDVCAIYAGKGELNPQSQNTIFSGTIKPEDMPYFLSAADVFVLPTLNEGCSNAIIEAVACGLPVISSNLPFNRDVLDSSNAILINPDDIIEIRDAILKIKNTKYLREKLAEGSLRKAKDLDLKTRAENIKEWIEAILDMWNNTNRNRN